MALGIRGFNPIWVEFDLQGKLFDDTFYLFVLENTIPYIPATVYHDPNLNVPWNNPIQFLGNGTLPVDIYFEDNVVYRLEFRQGPTQQDPLIYEVNNYIAGGRLTPNVNGSFPTDNQITNPQFALINFTSPLILTGITDPDPIEVAPGWFLDLAGTGNVTVSQVPLNNTNENTSNAPYALRLQLTGWDTDGVFLRQRFQQNGMLWANKTVSSTVTARVTGVFQEIHADLVPSIGTPTRVLDAPTVTGTFVEYTGHGTLPDTTNSNTPPAAFIDYKLALPSTTDIYVSSIQLIVQDAEDLSEPAFEQDSINRQIDHTFNYYKPQLAYKPIPSLLTAWDFSLNPAQFVGPSVNIVQTGATYLWDQTIGESVVGAVAVTRDSVTGGFEATTANADEGFYIMQYLSGEQAKKIVGSKMAVNVQAFRGEAGGSVTCTVYLFCSRAAGAFPTLPIPIGNMTADGTFTVSAANWTEIPRSGLGEAYGTLSAVNRADYSNLNDATDLNFNGWQLVDPAQISDTDKFAIVVTFSCPTSGTVVSIGSIGLMSGDIATRPAPQTLDQVLAECEYYYEKSYDTNLFAGSNTTSGQEFGEQLTNVSGGNIQLITRKFGIQYRRVKRIAPTSVNNSLILYTPPGTASNVLGIIRNGGSSFANAPIPISNWQIEGPGSKYVSFLPVNVTPLVSSAGVDNFSEAYVAFQYVADVRLGMF